MAPTLRRRVITGCDDAPASAISADDSAVTTSTVLLRTIALTPKLFDWSGEMATDWPRKFRRALRTTHLPESTITVPSLIFSDHALGER